jgi:hypothetical protein
MTEPPIRSTARYSNLPFGYNRDFDPVPAGAEYPGGNAIIAG